MSGERLCVCCPVLHPDRDPCHYDTPAVCEGCRDQMDGLLGRLPELCALLPAAFERRPARRADGTRVRSTPRASEPLHWPAFDLAGPADPRKPGLRARAWLGLDPEADWQDGDLSVATELDAMARDWLTYRPGEHLPAPTVSSLCGWLSNRLDWACGHHPAIDEVAAILAELTRAVGLAGRLDHGRGVFVGRCPSVLRDGSRCATGLRVDPYSTRVSCGRCGASWDRERGWVALAGAQEAAGLARWQDGSCSTPDAATA